MNENSLERFVTAQELVFDRALAELVAGHKRTHWMWFIFPQIAGMRQSVMARRYAIASLAEARAYLSHELLGARLRQTTQAVLSHVDESGQPRASVHSIFGSPDDLKFHASMTLFHLADPSEPMFKQALDVFFDGARDSGTLSLI